MTAEHGKGLYVRAGVSVVRLSRSRLSRAARQDNQAFFLGDAEANAFKPTVQTTVRIEEAGLEHADALGIEPGSPVLVRDRVMSADGVVVQLATSRLPRDLTEGTQIEQGDTGAGGIHARLEEAGVVLHHHRESVATRMPTAEEAVLLQLPPGVPVLAVRRTTYDTTGRAVEVNDMTLVGNRYELVYDIPAD
ncbi:hypothetical protein GCM10029976_046260 [Kribbella albertanoniae]